MLHAAPFSLLFPGQLLTQRTSAEAKLAWLTAFKLTAEAEDFKQRKISAPQAQNKENKQGKQSKQNNPPPLAKCAPPMLLSAGPKQSGPSHSKLSGAPRLLWTSHEKQKTTRG